MIKALPLISMSTISDSEVVVIDTETTGLNPTQNADCDEHGPDRICSMAAILMNRTQDGGWIPVSQRVARFNPGRPVAYGAARVNKFFWSAGDEPAPVGMQDLRGEKTFAQSAGNILAYIDDRLKIAHNAPFDMSFIDAELLNANFPMLGGNYACTRAAYAEKIGLGRNHPRAWGTRLDDLCTGFGIPRGARAQGHGASVDAGLCAEGFAYLDFEGLMESLTMESLPHRSFQPALRP